MSSVGNAASVALHSVTVAFRLAEGSVYTAVQNTTLDDVFVHYTGRQLRDELQKAYAFTMPQRPGLQP